MNENNTPQRLLSSGFVLDGRKETVLYNGSPIKLSPIKFKVLQLLVAGRGNLITRKQLFDSVWPKQVVSDDALTRCLSDIRKELARYSAETLIETLPKRGYRWLPEVKANADDDTNALSLNRPKRAVLLTSISTVLFMVIGLLIAVSLTSKSSPEYVRVAFVSANANNAESLLEQQVIATLKQQVLATDNIRFLADRLTGSDKSYPISGFFSQARLDWLVEVNVEIVDDSIQVNYLLVDAQTALVHYSHMENVGNDETSMAESSQEFVNEMQAILSI